MDDEQALPLALAVDLGGTQMRAGVLRGANLLSLVTLQTGADRRPESMLPRAFAALEQALQQASVTLEQVAGIGIGAPGPLDSRTGIVYVPPNMPGWEALPLRQLFEQRYRVPVYVENDANAAALGEFLFGAGRGCQHIVYLTISTGIGGGVIADGRLLAGASGAAAELGHMTIDWQGERCTCGNTGCLEYIASGTSIARRASQLIQAGQGDELLAFARQLARQEKAGNAEQGGKNGEQDGHEEERQSRITARVVALAAAAGVPVAQQIIERAAEALGVGLVNIIHIFNPEKIILGGGVTQMGPLLLEPARRVVYERAMRAPREAVRIELARAGPNVGLVGAGALLYYYHNTGS
jgi:glucokinase